MKKPSLIELQNIKSDNGDLTIFELQKHIDFEIKRVFILDKILNFGIKRGFHAHKVTEQFLVCLVGEIDFYSELPSGEKFIFRLTNKTQGIYIPPFAWHHMSYSIGSIQLVCASHLYNEDDYLRTKDSFLNYYKI
jgi:hypothetical protein